MARQIIIIVTLCMIIGLTGCRDNSIPSQTKNVQSEVTEYVESCPEEQPTEFTCERDVLETSGSTYETEVPTDTTELEIEETTNSVEISTPETNAEETQPIIPNNGSSEEGSGGGFQPA